MNRDWPWRTTRKGAALLIVLLALSAGCHAGGGAAVAELAGDCDRSDIDPWLGDFRNRIRAHDTLYRHAAENYGTPHSCTGKITAEFDGRKYGFWRFSWKSGRSFTVSTMPPESSIVELRSEGGFPDPAGTRSTVEKYVRSRGLPVGWTAPAVSSSPEGGFVEEFGAKPAGVNAFVRFHYDKERRLVGAVISTAL